MTGPNVWPSEILWPMEKKGRMAWSESDLTAAGFILGENYWFQGKLLVRSIEECKKQHAGDYGSIKPCITYKHQVTPSVIKVL